MDIHVDSVAPHLLEGLDFNLSPTAAYILERRNATFQAAGSNSYSASGVKVIRWNLTDASCWLDPSSLKIRYTIQNTHATNTLKPCHRATPAALFTRMRILCGGQLAEEIGPGYGRLYQMFSNMQSHGRQEDDMVEGFGIHEVPMTDSTEGAAGIAAGIAAAKYLTGDWEMQTIAANNGTKTVCFTPLAGLFQQTKYLPLNYLNGITIEYEIGDVADAFYNGKKDDQTGREISWQISDAVVLADLITLDPSLEAQYAMKLSQGGALPLSFASYALQTQSIQSANFNIHVSRAFDRLKGIFLTVYKSENDTVGAGEVERKITEYFKKMPDNAKFTLSIGGKKWPEYPINSRAEFFYRLRMAMGIHGSSAHSMNITSHGYASDKFVIGLDLERALQAGYSGISTKAGSLISLQLENAGATATDIDSAHVVCQFDALLRIKDSGVEVLG